MVLRRDNAAVASGFGGAGGWQIGDQRLLGRVSGRIPPSGLAGPGFAGEATQLLQDFPCRIGEPPIGSPQGYDILGPRQALGKRQSQPTKACGKPLRVDRVGVGRIEHQRWQRRHRSAGSLRFSKDEVQSNIRSRTQDPQDKSPNGAAPADREIGQIGKREQQRYGAHYRLPFLLDFSITTHAGSFHPRIVMRARREVDEIFARLLTVADRQSCVGPAVPERALYAVDGLVQGFGAVESPI
ncbi:MAG: hypothetical protein AB7P20_12430 [Rhizobiaceae bacterium]